MTEADWLTCTDRPLNMLACVQGFGLASDRKMRLAAVAVAMYSRVNSLESAVDRSSLNAIKVAERFADGLASKEELAQAGGTTVVSWWTVAGPDSERALRGLLADDYPPGKYTLACDVLRDLFGNPYRKVAVVKWIPFQGGGYHMQKSDGSLVSIGDQAWPHLWINRDVLSWSDGTVVRLATSIYDRKAFEEMPLLGDALEEAGITDLAILEHCRGGACQRCSGKGYKWKTDHDNNYSANVTCPQCDGSGRVQARHWRGDWLIDILTGRK